MKTIRQIDLLMNDYSQYDVLHHFTSKFHEALIRAGVKSHLYFVNAQSTPLIADHLQRDRPDYTLSFNALLPSPEGIYLCDFLGIPHINYMVDQPNRCSFLLQSPNNIISCIDRAACDFLKPLHSGRVFFLPHAVEKELSYIENRERIFDVVLLGSCIDYAAIADYWRLFYPKPLAAALFEAAEITLSDQTTPFWQALIQTFDALAKSKGCPDLRSYDIINLINQLEMYVRGYDRARLISALSHTRIDIFGNSKKEWERCLKSPSHCVFHDQVPFAEAIEIMKQAKLVLNSSIMIKSGGHERIFTALSCGAVPLTSENCFLQETFSDGSNILFYTYSTLDRLNDRVNTLLKDDELRKKIAKNGHRAVLENHTWDHRAATLIQELEKT